ncbi:hypothetical protein [Dyella sp.]|uniref:hypothetical protein n=1 Tax=Dyella sp. TaxID=1869338 RepID=UPI002FDAAFE5
MAEEWIKVRTKLARDGRLNVMSRTLRNICNALGVTSNVAWSTAMLGSLVKLWMLADEHADESGVIHGYTSEDVDNYVGFDGFCAALPPEWINLTGEWVQLPDYTEHNGSTGKTRAQTQKRVKKSRNGSGATNVTHEALQNDRAERYNGNADTVSKTVTREEKNREDSLGNSSTRAEIPEHTDASARAVVEACKVLRKLGMLDVQPQRPELLDLVGRGCTVEQMALTAAELALKSANFFNDTDLHPELLELFASGATQAQMLMTQEQYTRLRNCVPKLPYLAATLIGRAKDAARLGESHGSATTSTAFQAAHADLQRGGQRGRPESAASRAERARREGDARDEAAVQRSAGFESA